MPFESPQGVAFAFNGKAFLATSISVSASGSETEVTAINDTVGSHPYGRFEPGVMKNVDVSIEWVGREMPDMDEVYSINVGEAAASLSGIANAVCTSCQVTAQAGDLLKGTASFKISHDKP